MIKAIGSRFPAFLTLSVLVMMLSACTTATEVRKQIDESNEQILLAVVAGDAADLSDIEDPQAGASDDYQKTAARIQGFIEQNPNLPAVTNPLKLRLAVLHMVNGQANLAMATFEEVQPDSSLSERDLLIFNLRDGLVWWYELNSAQRSFEVPDKQAADDFLDDIQEQLDSGTVTTAALKAWLTHLSITIAERRIRNFVPGESVATIEETQTRVTDVITTYTDWWATAMRQDLKALHEILPQECPRSGISPQEWQKQIQRALRTKRQAGGDFRLNHWSLFRWYPLFFCNTEDLQIDWLKSTQTGELLPVSNWIECKVSSRANDDTEVRCAPKPE